ncbi:MAG TPA: nucleotidyltransferase [Marinilabiliaceae bacterium]|nr:nucleotidyltransferase [Marinilabiliaceae bacterium]
MIYRDNHIIFSGSPLKRALEMLNLVPKNLSLFVVNQEQQLIGTLTDGDIRRGLLAGISVDASVDEFMFTRFRTLKGTPDPIEIKKLRELGIKLVPVLDRHDRIVKILDLGFIKTSLPVDAVIMAGGRGERLRPLTDNVPKPMLPLGGRPIIEYNIDRLSQYGITNIHISINYLGQQIVDYFGDGSLHGLNIKYVAEEKPLGTIGAVKLIEKFENPYILVMNSDLFTDADFESMWFALHENGADLCVASIPYTVNIPFAIMERTNGYITGLKEKPTHTHYANAGIYLFRKDMLKHIPMNEKFNATDLIEAVIENKNKVIDLPLTGYWIDIGRHEEYEKAKMIVQHVQR